MAAPLPSVPQWVPPWTTRAWRTTRVRRRRRRWCTTWTPPFESPTPRPSATGLPIPRWICSPSGAACCPPPAAPPQRARPSVTSAAATRCGRCPAPREVIAALRARMPVGDRLQCPVLHALVLAALLPQVSFDPKLMVWSFEQREAKPSTRLFAHAAERMARAPRPPAGAAPDGWQRPAQRHPGGAAGGPAWRPVCRRRALAAPAPR